MKAMQVIVDRLAETIEKFVGFHCLNNVVEALDLSSPINNLIERGFNDRARLDNHKLVERIVFVRGAQPTKRIPIQKNVVPNFKVADEVARNYFDFRCHCLHLGRFKRLVLAGASSANLRGHLAIPR
jgi:hypothetical protein